MVSFRRTGVCLCVCEPKDGCECVCGWCVGGGCVSVCVGGCVSVCSCILPGGAGPLAVVWTENITIVVKK